MGQSSPKSAHILPSSWFFKSSLFFKITAIACEVAYVAYTVVLNEAPGSSSSGLASYAISYVDGI